MFCIFYGLNPDPPTLALKKCKGTPPKNKGSSLCGTPKFLEKTSKTHQKKSKENRKRKKARKSKEARFGGSGTTVRGKSG